MFGVLDILERVFIIIGLLACSFKIYKTDKKMKNDVQKFEDIDNTMLLDALNSVIWYNGLSPFLFEIKYDIENNIGIDEAGQFTLNEYEDRHENLDEQEEIFWMILVLLFGDYGTSPRRGRLYIQNKDGILKFLNTVLQDIKEK